MTFISAFLLQHVLRTLVYTTHGLLPISGSVALPNWVEHALETDGVPYLHTPDEELSWLVLHSTDVAIFALGLLLAAGAALLFCIRAALLGLQPYMPDKVKQV